MPGRQLSIQSSQAYLGNVGEELPPDSEAPPPPPPVESRQSAPVGGEPEPPPTEEAAPVTVPEPQAVSPLPVGPASGSQDRHERSLISSWQHSLVQRLQQAKRFPKSLHGASGTVRVAFTIDRQGHLISHRILTTSGTQLLDEAAISLLERAQPFPVPPAGVLDQELSFVVPVRYGARP